MRPSGNAFASYFLSEPGQSDTPKTGSGWKLSGGLLLFLAAMLSYTRGLQIDLDYPGVVYGTFHFSLNYSAGFVARGLIGEGFQWLGPTGNVDGVIYAAHIVLSVAMLGLLLALGRAMFRVLSPVHALTMLLILLAAPILPAVGFHAGYLDVYLVVGFLLAVLALLRGWTLAALMICTVLPLVHELFLFYWVSPAIVLLWLVVHRQFPPFAGLTLAVAPVLSYLLIAILKDNEAAAMLLREAEIPTRYKEALIEQQISQTLTSALARMVQHWKDFGGQVTIATTLYNVCTVLALVHYATIRRLSPAQIALICVAAFAPLSVLAVASDLGRLAVIPNLTAVITILMVETYLSPPARSFNHRPLLVIAPLTLLSFQLPHFQSIFEAQLVYNHNVRLFEILSNLYFQ